MKALLMLAALLGPAAAQSPDVREIMRLVALNQGQAREDRLHFAYRQKEDIRLHRLNGKLAHEEHRDYWVTPETRGVHKVLMTFEGRYERKGRYISFTQPNTDYENVGIDAAIAEAFTDDVTNDPDSRDGIANQLFPLTYHQQLEYKFHLVGTETFRGRAVYRVAFEPKDKDATIWKGEALIDTAQFQPVSVYTRMARSVPMAVRVLLGTNVRGLGFSVIYQKFDDGVWFPVSYGGEFELQAAFFYKRTISISLANSDFHRADVSSKVIYATGEK
jgi:hypothetical protein